MEECVELREDVTDRLHAMALLINAIGTVHDAGLVSHEKAFEKVNYCIDHVEDVLKLDRGENG